MNDRDSIYVGTLEVSEEISQLFHILARANQIGSNTELDELLEQMLDLIVSVCGAEPVRYIYLIRKRMNWSSK